MRGYESLELRKALKKVLKREKNQGKQMFTSWVVVRWDRKETGDKA